MYGRRFVVRGGARGHDVVWATSAPGWARGSRFAGRSTAGSPTRPASGGTPPWCWTGGPATAGRSAAWGLRRRARIIRPARDRSGQPAVQEIRPLRSTRWPARWLPAIRRLRGVRRRHGIWVRRSATRQPVESASHRAEQLVAAPLRRGAAGGRARVGCLTRAAPAAAGTRIVLCRSPATRSAWVRRPSRWRARWRWCARNRAPATGACYRGAAVFLPTSYTNDECRGLLAYGSDSTGQRRGSHVGER